VRRGFTLLEVLVAMTLLFVVLTTVYTSFEIHIRSMERGRQVQRDSQTARLVFAMMARDLQSAYWEPKPEDWQEEEEAQQKEGKVLAETQEEKEMEVLFLSQPIREDGRPWDRLAFLTLGPSWSPLLSRYPWVHAVEYRLARDQDTRRSVLVRRENLTPGDDLLSGGEEWALAEDVLGFEILCMDHKGEMVNTWDSRARKSLPKAVVVHIWMSDPRRPQDEPTMYTLRVALPPSVKSGEETS
jgi:prepilin-type N-terminal cleavage/methylation domain-containing protein